MCEPATLAMIAANAGTISTVASVAGLAVSAYGSYQQSKTTAKIASNNAMQAEWAAEDAQKRGELDAQKVSRQASALKSSQRVVLAAKGLDLGYGTAADLQDQTDFFGQQDINTTRNNALKDVAGYRNQGANYVAQGNAAKYNSMLSATGSLLTGAGSVADKWYASKR